jgi:D-beta-D-heptose 7-phosphate kinase/D-beta-D-heptose 1-phosphate adenosyltransferase
MEQKRVLTIDELLPIVERYRSQGKKIVFTNGCFDIIHVGHVRYLGEAKKVGDVLIVGVNSDASVRGLKGPDRPIVGERERAAVVASLRSVDYVVIFGEADPLTLILALKPDVLVKGEDWSEDKIVGAREVTSWGGKVVRAPLIPENSTTSLIDKIKGKK